MRRCHIGCGDVPAGTDLVSDFLREPSGQAFFLVVAEFLRIDDDTPFPAAERDIHHGTFPRHPHREADALVGVHLGVIAEPALVGAANVIVLCSIASKDVDGAVVPLERNGDFDDSGRVFEAFDDAVVDIGPARSGTELPASRFEG